MTPSGFKTPSDERRAAEGMIYLLILVLVSAVACAVAVLAQVAR